MKRFWILSALWLIVVFAAVPILVETLDARGIGLVIPGVPVTVSEILFGGLLAFLPPLVVLRQMRLRRRAELR